MNTFLFRNLSLILITASLFCSCDERQVFERQESFPNQHWNSSDLIKFDALISDTISSHNIIFNIRHTGDYPFQNLFLFVETHNPAGNLVKDTLEIFFANDEGRWVGSGSGSLYSHEFYYKRNVRFPISGMYSFTVEQAMRKEKLEGINNLGVRIERLHGSIK